MAKSLRKKWLCVAWNLIKKGFVMMIVCWCHCNADKGCGDAFNIGQVYSAEYDEYQTQLEFTEMLSLEGYPSVPYGITHDRLSHDIYITVNAGRILKVDADTMEVETVIELPGEDPRGISVYNNMLFWADHSGKIYSCNTDGTRKTVIADTGTRLWAIDIDEQSNRFVYYGQYDNGILTKASFDWQLKEDVVIGLVHINAVEMDPTEGMVYAASEHGEIIKYDPSTGKDIVVYKHESQINDVSLLHQLLLYVDIYSGLKGITKTGEAVDMSVTGLPASPFRFYSIDVVPGNETRSLPPTTNQPPTLKSKTEYQVTTEVSNSTNICNAFENEEAMHVDEILTLWESLNSPFPDVLESTQRRRTGKCIDMQLFVLDEISGDVSLTDEKQSYQIAVNFATDAWEDTEGYKLLLSVLKRDFGPINNVNGITYNLGSRILSITVFNKNASIVRYVSGKLFNITFSLMPNITGNPSCRFLASSKPIEWSPEGCFVSASNSSHVTCSCDHMTSFAVLMQFAGDVSNYYSPTVEIFVSFGSIISTVALLIGLTICVILWRNSQIDKEKLLIHAILMTAMVISYVVTFIWIVSKQVIKADPICCLAFMIVRYHVFMTMFCATFLEAVHLFRMIILVFGANRSYRSVYVAISIGFPMLITSIVAAIGRGNMHSEESCWLTGSFIWAFIGPVVALLTANVTILVLVVRQTLKVSQQRNPPDNIGTFRIAVRCAWLLLPMLGVTWLLAPLGNIGIGAAYLFDILTSLQGLYFVFVTCYVNTEVRAILKREWIRKSGRVQPINLRQLQSPHRRMNVELPPPE